MDEYFIEVPEGEELPTGLVEGDPLTLFKQVNGRSVPMVATFLRIEGRRVFFRNRSVQ